MTLVSPHFSYSPTQVCKLSPVELFIALLFIVNDWIRYKFGGVTVKPNKLQFEKTSLKKVY